MAKKNSVKLMLMDGVNLQQSWQFHVQSHPYPACKSNSYLAEWKPELHPTSITDKSTKRATNKNDNVAVVVVALALANDDDYLTLAR